MSIIFTIIRFACELMTWAIVLRAVLSWFDLRPNVLTISLARITEPILAPLRRILPRTGTFDFTPLIAIILLQIIIYVLP